MEPDASSTDSSNAGSANISPAKRKKLQTYFQYGIDKRKTGDHDYAHTMFSQCFVGDPANLVYLEALLENLSTKFAGKKKKSKIRSSRNAFKKAHAAEEWKDCFKIGLELLNENPWDIPTLRALAEAAAAKRGEDEQYGEIELRFLRAALDSDPKNVETNKHCADSLARIGQYDQAIACLHRIEEFVPNKSEIQARISQLTMAKTAPSVLEDEEVPTAKAKVPKPGKTDQNPDEADGPAEKSIAGLERAISKDPSKTENYLDLADLQANDGDWKAAEATLRRALAASGNDIKVREKLEGVQMKRARLQVANAEKQAKAAPSEEAKQLVEKLKQDSNRLELGIFNSRVERYPDRKHFQYELAVRLKRGGSFKEAAKYFDATNEEPGYEASSLLQLGECLQQLRKYQEAQTRYLKARKLAKTQKKTEVLKLSLYRGGILAAGLKSWEQAKSLLDELIALDPGFRDAQSRLDKLKKIEDT